jgi:hypothetical protein
MVDDLHLHGKIEPIDEFSDLNSRDGCITADELADYGYTPEEVRCRCPHATEYTGLNGEPCWPRDDLTALLDGKGGPP